MGCALIDIPSSSSFAGLSYESETLNRQVEVICLDPETELFDYLENVKIIDDEQEIIFEDTFQIKCWNIQVILAEFEAAGMSVREDVSELFRGFGAHYFILGEN